MKVRSKMQTVLLVRSLAVVGIAATARCVGQPVESSPFFDKMSAGSATAPKPLDYVSTVVSRLSPDHNYRAVLTVGDAEIGVVRVYSASSRLITSPEFVNVNRCAWVPGHRHWLVVATGGADYGEGYIVLWTAPGRWRYLVRARHRDGEGYQLVGFSRDGHRLLYRHFGLGTRTPDEESGRVSSLSLPKA